jgi:hypothetical protein
MEPFGFQALAVAFCVATLLATRAIRKKSLSVAGAVAGFGVGFSIVATGWRGMVLLFFYQIASTATKYKKKVKQPVDRKLRLIFIQDHWRVDCRVRYWHITPRAWPIPWPVSSGFSLLDPLF